MENELYHLNKMREGLEKRQKSNPNYSLRAYARDLEIDASALSKVMNGKRSLTPETARRFAELLKLNEKEKTLFLESIFRTNSVLDQIKIPLRDDRFMLDESYYKVIAEWEHYAVLTLFDVAGFVPTDFTISERLGISQDRAEEVLKNLLKSGLLIEKDETYIKSHPVIRTNEDQNGRALNMSHMETLDLGKIKLEEISKELRDFSSSTLAIDMEKLPQAKTIIREFRMKMASLLKEGSRTEVYQLAVQFYPLSKIQPAKSEKLCV